MCAGTPCDLAASASACAWLPRRTDDRGALVSEGRGRGGYISEPIACPRMCGSRVAAVGGWGEGNYVARGEEMITSRCEECVLHGRTAAMCHDARLPHSLEPLLFDQPPQRMKRPARLERADALLVLTFEEQFDLGVGDVCCHILCFRFAWVGRGSYVRVSRGLGCGSDAVDRFAGHYWCAVDESLGGGAGITSNALISSTKSSLAPCHILSTIAPYLWTRLLQNFPWPLCNVRCAWAMLAQRQALHICECGRVDVTQLFQMLFRIATSGAGQVTMPRGSMSVSERSSRMQ
nr:hypothetical protein CFP56_50911 [Quercus suber]